MKWKSKTTKNWLVYPYNIYNIYNIIDFPLLHHPVLLLTGSTAKLRRFDMSSPPAGWIVPSGTMKASQQGGGFQPSVSVISLYSVTKAFGLFSIRVLTSNSGEQPTAAAVVFYYLRCSVTSGLTTAGHPWHGCFHLITYGVCSSFNLPIKLWFLHVFISLLSITFPHFQTQIGFQYIITAVVSEKSRESNWGADLCPAGRHRRKAGTVATEHFTQTEF